MQQKPRVLFILHLPPPMHGAAAMGKFIHDSQMVKKTFDGHYINLTMARNIDDVGAFKFHKLTTYVQLLRDIRKEVKSFHPDLVYVTPNTKGSAFYKDFFIIEMLKHLNCDVVSHFHNKGVSEWQHHWYNNVLYKVYFHNMKIILLADTLYADISKYVDRKDIFICPNGIPDVEIDDIPTEPKPKIPHILFLSNLLESKGILVLLDAFQILKERKVAFVCDVVGSESAEINTERLNEEISKRNLNDVINYHGSKFGHEKLAFFRKADIFAFPSYRECHPIVLLEAKQHGISCVSTDEGAIPDIIEHNVTGFIVPKHQSEPLADRLEQLITDEKLRRKMGKAGRKRFEQHFTLEKFEHRLKYILRHCISTA